jgi:hypothetical protein
MASVTGSWSRRAVVASAAALAVLAPTRVAVQAADTPVPQPPASTVPASTALDNPFLPDDENVTDCISAVPRPGCGSEERSDWRQGVLFGVVAAGLAAIGVRIAIGVRRRGRQQAHPG